MLAEIVFRPFEALLNRGLGESAAARELAAALEGRCLGLAIDGTPFDIRLLVKTGRIGVTLPDGAAPDARLAGGPLGMGRLLGGDPKAALREGVVRLTGDGEIARQFQELLRLAAPDLEREISRYIGEPLAREFAAARSAAHRWGEEATTDAAHRMAQYLKEDARLVPSASEVACFARDVDTFVNDVERAEARLARLKEAAQ